MEQSDLEEKVRRYKEAAEKGDARAKVELAFCYYQGTGVGQDLQAAFEWFKRAGEENEEPEALGYLGFCYENGYGVAPDYAKAAEWYEKAIEKGNEMFLYYLCNIGTKYMQGVGLEQDLEKAFEIFNLLAKHDNDIACFYMGVFYAYGCVVEQDFAKAVEWMEKADANGSDQAKDYIPAYKQGIADEQMGKIFFGYNQWLASFRGGSDKESVQRGEAGTTAKSNSVKEYHDDEDEYSDPIADFMDLLGSCKIEDKKVSQVEKAYGLATLPDMVKRMISICSDDDDNCLYNSEDVCIMRILTFDEVLNPENKYGVDYKSIGYVPVAYCLNNDYIFYSSKKGTWVWCDGDTKTVYVENKRLKQVIGCIDDNL